MIEYNIPTIEITIEEDLRIKKNEELFVNRFDGKDIKAECTTLELINFLKKNCPKAWDEATKEDMQKKYDEGYMDSQMNYDESH